MSENLSDGESRVGSTESWTSRIARIAVFVVALVFATMYGIGRYYSTGVWNMPSPKPHGVIATTIYGFQKLFFGDKFSNGEYIYGTSVFGRVSVNNTSQFSTADRTSGLIGNSVAASSLPYLSNGVSAVIARSTMIDENVKFGQIGQCKITSVAKISTRLEDTPGSGSAITYTDGTFGVSYDTVPGVVDSQQGDQIKLCLVSIPNDCPAGEDDGSVYSAENMRTKEKWSLPNSSHECGGA